MDLNARVDVNCGRKDERTENRTPISHLAKAGAQKLKWLPIRNILAQSWINFNQWFLRDFHFCVYANFSNGPWQPS